MEYRSDELSEKQLEYVNNHYNTTDNDSYHIISYNNFVFLLFVLGISLLFVNTYKTIYYKWFIRGLYYIRKDSFTTLLWENYIIIKN